MDGVMFNEKDFEYFDYIVEHKRNVMVAFNLMNQLDNHASTNNASTMWITKQECEELKRRVLEHDLTKFSPIEFYGYRKYFFTHEGEEKEANHHGISGKYYFQNDFNKAWEHHYTTNSHHPEFHKEKMSRVEMLEMILDWCAMSLKFGGNPLDYFLNKKSELLEKFENVIDFEYVEKYTLAQLGEVIVEYHTGKRKDLFSWF